MAANASITLTLDDGSGCYVVVVPVASFDPLVVARAAGEAAATFAATFARDTAERGEEWDPVVWRARHDSMLRSQKPINPVQSTDASR